MAASKLMSSFSSATSFGSGNIMVRLQTVLNVPLPHRIYETEAFIKATSTKELRNVLPLLLENIFGFGSEPGWGFDKITMSYNRHEFEYGRIFLSPEGPLLKVINALQADPYLSYEFPFSCLPGPTKRSLEEGGLPPFLVNKIQSSNIGRPVLSLSAFEFYLFHFAYCLVNNQWQRNSASWNNLMDYLYPVLVQDYLQYYLPLDKSAFATRCHIPSPVRSPVVPSVSMMSSPQSGSFGMPQSPVSPRSSQHTSLLRTSLNTSIKQHPFPHQPSLDQGETEVGRCDTVVQESFLPSSNHLRIVRLFVKYLHCFTNSASPEVITSQYQQPTVSALDEFKRSVRQEVVQKKLYSFLRHAFDRWPLDSSFRLVLETWLSYIQPWRYCDLNQRNTSYERLQDNEEKHVDVRWSKFINENLLFYTVLFREFFPHVFRMDLTSPFSSYMVYRVVKVMSTPNLSNLIEQAEMMLYESVPSFAHMSLGGDLDGSYSHLDHRHCIGTLIHQQLTDLERPGFLYQPMFGEDTFVKIGQLLRQVLAARAAVKALQEQTVSSSSSGWFSWLSLSSLFEGDSSQAYGDLTVGEVKKLNVHLDHSARKLCETFQLNVPDELTGGDNSLNTSEFSPSDRQSKSDSSIPDLEETEDGYQLTPLGRYQLVNGIRQFDHYYEGDPAEELIKSYENTTMVRMFHRLCSNFNQKFGKNMTRWCGRGDLIGRMACVYFAPPISPEQNIQSPLSRQLKEKLSTPRLSLRFLASYRNLMSLAMCYLLLHFLFGFGPVGFLFVLSLVTLAVGLFKALLKPGTAKLKQQ